MNARVSAIIPAYNAAATIARAIESVLAQRFGGAVEIIVSDDGSADGTAAAAGRFGSRVTLVRGSNRGPAAARNAGVRASHGEYIAFLDADDAWLPHKLARMMAALEGVRESSLAYSDAIRMDGQGRIVSASYYRRPGNRTPSMNDVLAELCNMLPSTIVMRRDKYYAAGCFCEEFGRNHPQWEDTWFCVRAREQGPFLYIAEPLALYTVPLSFAERLRRRNIAVGHGLPGTEIARLLTNYELMARLAAQRYGRRARRLLRAIRRSEADFLAGVGLTAIAAGDRASARAAYAHAMRIPHGRVKTAARMAFALLPPAAARMLTAAMPPRMARAFAGPAQA
jgi:glycosyltransferase involved in cell wall biosynthesis